MMPEGMKTALLLTTACLLLGACAKAGESAQRVANSMHQEGQKMDRKVRGWFDSRGVGEAEREQPLQPDTAYCYRTIAETNCYAYPIEGAESRLRGKQLPPEKPLPANHLPMERYSNEVVLIDPTPSVAVRELPHARAARGNEPLDLSPQR